MTLQVSLIGIAIASVFYFVAFLVLYRLGRHLLSPRSLWPVLIPATIVVLLLPWLDEFWIAWHFAEACKDAGVYVSRKVAVDGFFDSTMRSGYERIEKEGYRFMEHPARLGSRGVEHVERRNSQWVTTELEGPTARFEFRFADPRQSVPIGYRLWKYEYEVVDRGTGEVIGRDISYHRYPGLVEGLWVGALGSGQTICRGEAPHPPAKRHLLYQYVFSTTRTH